MIVKATLAGLTGVAAMTAAQTVEMRISGRAASMVPGHVASKLLGLHPSDDEALARISTGMHWVHGMTHGLVRAAIGRTGLRGPAAAAAHFALMWPSDAILYKVLGIAPWPWEWSVQELAPDVLHKGVYVMATSAAYDRLA